MDNIEITVFDEIKDYKEKIYFFNFRQWAFAIFIAALVIPTYILLKEKIGEEVTSFSSVEGVKWQLFYDDADNYYLIASDYVPIDTLPNELYKESQAEGETKYKAWFATWDGSSYKGTIVETGEWSKGTASNTITGNPLTSKYLRWVGSSVNTVADNPNMKAVAYMMDTNKWSDSAYPSALFQHKSPPRPFSFPL